MCSGCGGFRCEAELPTKRCCHSALNIQPPQLFTTTARTIRINFRHPSLLLRRRARRSYRNRFPDRLNKAYDRARKGVP
jgi:hypothetical protein